MTQAEIRNESERQKLVGLRVDREFETYVTLLFNGQNPVGSSSSSAF